MVLGRVWEVCGVPSVSKGREVGRGVEAELSEGVPEGVPETCVQLGVFIFSGGDFGETFGEGYWELCSGTCARIGLRGGLLVLGRVCEVCGVPSVSKGREVGRGVEAELSEREKERKREREREREFKPSQRSSDPYTLICCC